MNTNESAVEECRRALEACPHDHGTVQAMCRVCLGSVEIFLYDIDETKHVVIDWPRCTGESGYPDAEVCPCLESFHPETIDAAIKLLRGESSDQLEATDEDAEDDLPEDDDDLEQDDNSEEAESIDDQYSPLCEALKWVQVRDRPGVPLTAQSAAEQLEKLRAWAEENKEIRVPHPKATLILDLLDHGMIEFATLPETGKLVFRAKGAKEEFSRFIAEQQRSYQHDQMTICALLCFAYGLSNWEFDPAELQKYARGRVTLEISSSGHDVEAPCGMLRGEQEGIEGVLREAFGCWG
jgi:hypothetical protein